MDNKSMHPASNAISGSSLTVRSKVILLFYLVVALVSFVRSAMGPCMPFLRTELGFSYTIAAYHFSAISVGIIIAGSIGDRIIPKLGRHRAFWLGFSGVTAGVVLVTALHAVPGTIFGMFMMGLCTSFMGQCIDSTITERLAEHRTVAIAETNIVASVSCMVAPMAIGSFVGAGANWRAPLLLAVIGCLIAFFRYRKIEVPPPKETATSAGNSHLSPAYWAYWLVILLSCAAEWSIIFWSTEFLIHAGNLASSTAASAVSAFFISMLLGRLYGSRAATKYDTTRVLPIFAALALCGFLIFWLSRSVPFMVSGLFLTGLGISNLYPYTLSAALGLNPAASARATSRMGIAGGASGLFGPLLLGCLADQQGIVTAYAAVAALLAFSLIVIVAANRISRQQTAQTQTAIAG